MDYIGIKELKNQAPRIMKAVREEGARYVVTYHGRPTALIVPLDDEVIDAAFDHTADALIDDFEVDEELEREREALRREIDAAWISDKTGVEIISEQRR